MMSNTKVLNWRWLYALVLLFLAVFVACCQKEVMVAPVEVKPIHITIDSRVRTETLAKSHLYQWMNKPGDELPDFAMYTYVLFNRTQDNSERGNLYKSLVEYITSSTTAVYEYVTSFDRSLYNLFLIPSESSSEIAPKSILTQLAVSVEDEKLKNSLNSNPGPFLISTAEPISNLAEKREVQLLYVDLSKTNPAAIPEVVAAYKKRLTTDTVQGVERFSSIKLSLLNVILDADDFMSIVKVAYAGWIKD